MNSQISRVFTRWSAFWSKIEMRCIAMGQYPLSAYIAESIITQKCRNSSFAKHTNHCCQADKNFRIQERLKMKLKLKLIRSKRGKIEDETFSPFHQVPQCLWIRMQSGSDDDCGDDDNDKTMTMIIVGIWLLTILNIMIMNYHLTIGMTDWTPSLWARDCQAARREICMLGGGSWWWWRWWRWSWCWWSWSWW